MIYKNLIESYDYSVYDYKNSRYYTSCNICTNKYIGTITDFRNKQFRCLDCVENEKKNEIESNGFAIVGKSLNGYSLKCVNCNTVTVKKYNTIKLQGFRCIACESIKYKEKKKSKTKVNLEEDKIDECIIQTFEF